MHKHGIIIGAGIAGLTTAIAMQRNGMPVQVYESAAHILPLGAGIWMAPNAMQVFDRLGLADKINSAGVPLNKIEVADKAFKPVMRTNQDHIRKRFGFTTTAIKRSRLQEILVAETGTENILLAKTCTAIKEEGDNLDIRFSDGSAVGRLAPGEQ